MQLVRNYTRLRRPASQLSLRTFHEQRNKVLIIRRLGGLGDILMHRMIFEDFKRLIPNCHITFACPKEFHDLANNHPFVDAVRDSEIEKHRLDDYAISYDTTYSCLRYELSHSPDKVVKHRADIWAEHCGVLLLRHNMHISIEEQYKEWGKRLLGKVKDNNCMPSVCFAPMSYDLQRTLNEEQCEGVIDGLREMGLFVFTMHAAPIPHLIAKDVPCITKLNLLQWASLIHASDYVISVDTSVFHIAGAWQKPLVGIFSFADGLVRGQYYDFILVQKHRKNGDWECGPCFNYANCTKDPKAKIKPCMSEITSEMVLEGVRKMVKKYPLALNMHYGNVNSTGTGKDNNSGGGDNASFNFRRESEH